MAAASRALPQIRTRQWQPTGADDDMTITLVDGSASIGATEYSLPNASTTLTPKTDDCVLQTFIDFANMAAGDEYRIRIREKINAGTQRIVYDATVEGVQGAPFITPSLILGDGWDVTVQKVSGTDRTIAWSLRKTT